MHKYAIIVAGGKGERMGNSTPKQFLLLKNKPILMHTIEKFKQAFPNIKIILALPKNQIDFWEELCFKYNFTSIPHQIVAGGKTRFESVKNALQFITQESIIAVHDGVRPLVSEQLIKSCFSTTEKHSNAVPAIDVTDSLRFVSKSDGSNKTVTRSCYKNVQTPQCFSSKILLQAYQQPYNKSFTDDASVVENINVKINLIDGCKSNIKITTKEDLALAEHLLKN